MYWTALLIAAAITLSAALYAQLRLPGLTPSGTQAWIARAVLALTAIGFGAMAVSKTVEGASPAMQIVIFLTAFGLVHTPAAIVLLLKTWQRSGPAGH